MHPILALLRLPAVQLTVRQLHGIRQIEFDLHPIADDQVRSEIHQVFHLLERGSIDDLFIEIKQADLPAAPLRLFQYEMTQHGGILSSGYADDDIAELLENVADTPAGRFEYISAQIVFFQ